MAWLQKLIIGLVVIFLILAALVFSLNNQVSVSLNFLFFETAAYGVAFWLILSFVAGGIIGMLLTSLAMIRISVSRRQLQRKLDHNEKQLEKARLEAGRKP
ncbi:lipopolysaccharide assembly protein LapA domain-containing protein [Marinobacter fonticola]|uniref:lipopolysaccharide assembly protein LapA domain-containing protein n=1 Tax=Marinobacter fonticola TaxID=2603215 RepID=UPI0011E650FE|nr:LapA family protein [Marinobacter fonticola]